MGEKRKSQLRSVLVVAILTILIGAVFLITKSIVVLLTLLGGYIGLVVSLLLSYLERIAGLEQQNQISAQITKNVPIWNFYEKTIPSLTQMSNYDDSIYKDLLQQALTNLYMDFSRIALGVFDFRAESWRRPYHQLLSQEDISFYYSTALIKSPNYWQDKPGRASIEFLKKIATSVDINKIFIIWDAVWDNEDIKKRVKEQVESEMNIAVIRQSEIPPEEDLLHDFGIYGQRAVGYQFLDEKCRTERFELHFNRTMYMKTLDRFNRLKLYATEESTKEYLSKALG